MAISVEDDYSSGNFMQMQEQAIKRAREMQKKSKTIESTPSLNSNTNKPPKPPIAKACAPKGNQKANGFQKSSPQNALSSLSEILRLDNDRALILPLLIFLGKEGADDMLLLALLYIMS